ncbi:uncharacterized protein DUF2804 [Desulfobotulus alkaliphilus]|uniref:Uncharacterized protein DUF2804 n=1 Tax=Desulfobotulus alkaliphilus TaxID=622671 RepID=A0A562S7U5_9BACT|nr:DUF2804 domain-containing protein [Desulfobotulus alkaliphilus]TWI77378.1 uncharacterized protein DUF2804 [Desulfobotulus alkaliphilus]
MPRPIICPETGRPVYGRHDGPVTINLKDFHLRSAMGRPVPGWFQRFKYRQFMFFGISDQNFSAGVALADLHFAQQAFFYVKPAAGLPWVHTSAMSLLPANPMNPESEFPDFFFQKSGLMLHFQKNCLEARYKDAHLHILLGESPSPLRLCTRTGWRGWTFTRKAASIPASGSFRCHNVHRDLSPETCRALTDRTCGILRRETFWNWAAATGILASGEDFGMNLAWGVNETGFTENRIWIRGMPVNIGPVIFEVPENRSSTPWQIYSEDKSLCLSFTPSWAMTQRVSAGLIATDFVQNTGFFSGMIHIRGHAPLILSDLPGWTEDHYVRW